jgi:hypothetical protein
MHTLTHLHSHPHAHRAQLGILAADVGHGLFLRGPNIRLSTVIAQLPNTATTAFLTLRMADLRRVQREATTSPIKRWAWPAEAEPGNQHTRHLPWRTRAGLGVIAACALLLVVGATSSHGRWAEGGRFTLRPRHRTQGRPYIDGRRPWSGQGQANIGPGMGAGPTTSSSSKRAVGLSTIPPALASAFPDLALWLTGPADVRRALCEALHPGLKRAPVPVPRFNSGNGRTDANLVTNVTADARAPTPPASFSNIPVYVLAHNNPTHLHAMVRFLRCYGVSNITVYDTASTLPLHLDLLDALDAHVTVQRLPDNAGPRAFLEPANLAGLPRHFALTDPDLRPHPDLPPNFLAYLAFLTRAFPGRKAGFALDLALRDHFLPGVHDPASGATIAEWEQAHFWGARLPTPLGGPPDPLFDASIDTTFAVYDRDAYTVGSGDGVRVGGTFTATHVPWLCFAMGAYVSDAEWAHARARPDMWSSTGRLARAVAGGEVDVCGRA